MIFSFLVVFLLFLVVLNMLCFIDETSVFMSKLFPYIKSFHSFLNWIQNGTKLIFI